MVWSGPLQLPAPFYTLAFPHQLQGQHRRLPQATSLGLLQRYQAPIPSEQDRHQQQQETHRGVRVLLLELSFVAHKSVTKL